VDPVSRFAGRAYHARRGIALILHGLPRRLRHGHARKLTLHLTDAFGITAAGLVVLATGPHHFRATSLTDGHGRIVLRLPRSFKGRLKLAVDSVAYTRLVRRLNIT
jgi:hypothetical protein